MFKEPEERSPSRTAEKIDRAAASSRSSIRRERTIRGRYTGREFRVTSPIIHDGFTSRTSPPGSGRRAQLMNERMERIGRRWSTMTDNVRHIGEDDIESTRRRQAGEELLRDALEYARPGHRMRLMARSPRTSALRFEVARPPRSTASPVPEPEPEQESETEPERSAEEQALLARPYMPSPPYSFRDTTSSRPRGTAGHLGIVPAEPTPGFAPAQGVHRDNEERDSADRSTAPRDYTPPGESSWTASYPPLRRVGHLSPRPESRVSRYGGLGDRRRSVSSSSSGGEHDAWETLLTTMEPDAHLPSADSSFTSASASNSTRQSRHSSQTRTTSFATTTTPTEHESSRPTSPLFPYFARPDAPQMDLDIQNPQYSCLSEESRERMRTMLSIIRDSRDFRAANPTGTSTSAIEQLRRADENTIISNHFDALRTLDDMRSATAAANHFRPRLTVSDGFTTTSTSTYPTFLPREALEQRMAMDLARVMERQSQQVIREIESERANRAGGRGSDSQPRASGSPGPQPPQQWEENTSLPRSEEELLFRMEVARAVRLGHDRRGPETSAATGPDAEHNHEHGQGQEQDLNSLQRVIERMARRQDIPDQWWAAAGLVRAVRESQ